jgi:hypothetical protein
VHQLDPLALSSPFSSPCLHPTPHEKHEEGRQRTEEGPRTYQKGRKEEWTTSTSSAFSLSTFAPCFFSRFADLVSSPFHYFAKLRLEHSASLQATTSVDELPSKAPLSFDNSPSSEKGEFFGSVRGQRRCSLAASHQLLLTATHRVHPRPPAPRPSSCTSSPFPLLARLRSVLRRFLSRRSTRSKMTDDVHAPNAHSPPGSSTTGTPPHSADELIKSTPSSSPNPTLLSKAKAKALKWIDYDPQVVEAASVTDEIKRATGGSIGQGVASYFSRLFPFKDWIWAYNLKCAFSSSPTSTMPGC